MDLVTIKAFAKAVLEEDTTGHDWQHALRVEENACKIYPPTLTEQEVESMRAACWLHDTIDEKLAASNRQSPATIETLLRDNDATFEQTEQILFIIQNLSYSKNLEQKIALDNVGRIVQDADRLDAIGAIGIARAFYYGGSQGDALYNEEKARAASELTTANYRNNTSVLNHFYEKLFHLKDQMNTVAGREEAMRRTAFMEKFIEEFYREVNQKR